MALTEEDLRAELSGTTVVVTGGGGLVGSRIAVRLRRLGARVIAVGKLDAYPARVYGQLFGVRPEDPDVIVGDIADTQLMKAVASQADYVVHAAAVADVAFCTRNPLAALQTNINGTQILLDAVRPHADRIRRFVFVSSAAVYGNGDPAEPGMQCWTEDRPPAPLSVYANTKVWGEHQSALVMDAAGISHTSVRYFSVYGEPQTVKENSHSWVVAWLAQRAKLGLPMRLNGGGRQVRDFVHVDDIAEATILAMVAPRAHRQVINVGSGVPTSIRSIAEEILTHYPDTRVEETPLPEGDPLGGFADTTRMRTLLDWTPSISVSAGVARYVAWLDDNPYALPDFLVAEAARVRQGHGKRPEPAALPA
ncbi:NAD-dependent epimerase/dehydratase family protein [Streptomyces sp. NPDC051211]|uniref:NAD-dependent epimerase/dehydratase family protein n=1 Tax=Streptomyces sp. NPDC051211 TaxID=3154643 RepID=UPI00344C44EB